MTEATGLHPNPIPAASPRVRSWRDGPVVVAVDVSPESTTAVHTAWTLAKALDHECYLVHAVRDYLDIPLPSTEQMKLREARRGVLEHFRHRFVTRCGEHLPVGAIAQLEIRSGNPVIVLRDLVRRLQAGLVVFGGRQHGRFSRWIGGSTACNAARALDVPVLIVGPSQPPYRRVLAAVDLSEAASLVVEIADDIAGTFGSELRLLHVLPPIPEVDPDQAFDRSELREVAMEHLESLAQPLTRVPAAGGIAVEEGPIAEAIAAACRRTDADLLVIGAHGSGQVSSLLLGTTTERLIGELPTSLLVVPTPLGSSAFPEA